MNFSVHQKDEREEGVVNLWEFFYVSKGLFLSGVWDARDRIKYGRRCRVPLHKKGISPILSR